MNKDNAKEYLPLVQALADGKTLQYFDQSENEWVDLDDVGFYDTKKYRIKPDEMEFDCWVCTVGAEVFCINSDMSGYKGGETPWRKIRVKEIV